MAEEGLPRLPKAGDVVGGKYALLRVVGKGGMGVVYEARHLRLDQRVALKFLRPRVLDTETIKRFEREARNACALTSMHVARVFDVDQTADGIPFIVSEMLDGRELLDELRERGPLPIEEAVDYVLQACFAMADAHAHGIVHRDLKPSNLYLAKQGKTHIVKVLDFGISKVASAGELELTTTGMLVGSPRYMSPEQVDGGKDVDTRTDIWSLGVILFQALTNAFPFEGDNLTGVAVAIATKPPRPLRELRPEVPEKLEAVVEKALAKAKDERYPTVKAFAHDLLPFGSSRVASSLVALPGLLSLPPPVGDAPRVVVITGEGPATPQAAGARVPSISTEAGPTELERARARLLKGAAIAAAGLAIAMVVVMRRLPSDRAAGAVEPVTTAPRHAAPPPETKSEPLAQATRAPVEPAPPRPSPAPPAEGAASEPAHPPPAASAAAKKGDPPEGRAPNVNSVARDPGKPQPSPAPRPTPAPTRDPMYL